MEKLKYSSVVYYLRNNTGKVLRHRKCVHINSSYGLAVLMICDWSVLHVFLNHHRMDSGIPARYFPACPPVCIPACIPVCTPWGISD